jgi:hypothetical protein
MIFIVIGLWSEPATDGLDVGYDYQIDTQENDVFSLMIGNIQFRVWYF